MLLHYLGKQKDDNCILLLKHWILFANRHTKHVHIITWSHGVYSGVNMSCKSTKLKKSGGDGLNSGKAVIQHLSENMRFSCFCAFPGSAEALLRWGWKIKYHLMVYLLNISAKNCQNRLKYIKVTACQSSVVFRHSVVLLP